MSDLAKIIEEWLDAGFDGIITRGSKQLAVIVPWDHMQALRDALEEHAEAYRATPTCEHGHPLVVATDAAVHLHMTFDGVRRAVVLPRAGDPGDLRPIADKFRVWTCSAFGDCSWSDEAADEAIRLALESPWPDLELEG